MNESVLSPFALSSLRQPVFQRLVNFELGERLPSNSIEWFSSHSSMQSKQQNFDAFLAPAIPGAGCSLCRVICGDIVIFSALLSWKRSLPGQSAEESVYGETKRSSLASLPVSEIFRSSFDTRPGAVPEGLVFPRRPVFQHFAAHGQRICAGTRYRVSWRDFTGNVRQIAGSQSDHAKRRWFGMNCFCVIHDER